MGTGRESSWPPGLFQHALQRDDRDAEPRPDLNDREISASCGFITRVLTEIEIATACLRHRQCLALFLHHAPSRFRVAGLLKARGVPICTDVMEFHHIP